MDSNVKIVHNDARITSSGSVVFTGLNDLSLTLTINIRTAPKGVNPGIRYFIQEVDPIDQSTGISAAQSTTILSSVGTTLLYLTSSNSGTIKVSWVITGNSNPTFPDVAASLSSKTVQIGTAANPIIIDTAAITIQPVSGTITANQGIAASFASAWPVEISDGTSTVGITSVLGVKALKVDVVSTVGGVGSGGTSSTFASMFPAAGTAIGFNDGSNMQGARVFDLDTGGGTEYNVGVSIRLPSNGGSVVGGTSSNPLRFDPTGTTPQPIKLTQDGTNFATVMVPSSGNNALATIQTCATGTITSVAVANTDTLLLAVNTNRRGAIIYNDTSSAILKIGFSTSTITTTNFSVQISAGGFFEVPFGYTGQVRGLWSVNEGGSSGARITEFA